jgi:hypothetical protein
MKGNAKESEEEAKAKRRVDGSETTTDQSHHLGRQLLRQSLTGLIRLLLLMMIMTMLIAGCQLTISTNPHLSHSEHHALTHDANFMCYDESSLLASLYFPSLPPTSRLVLYCRCPVSYACHLLWRKKEMKRKQEKEKKRTGCGKTSCRNVVCQTPSTCVRFVFL